MGGGGVAAAAGRGETGTQLAPVSMPSPPATARCIPAAGPQPVRGEAPLCVQAQERPRQVLHLQRALSARACTLPARLPRPATNDNASDSASE